VDVPDAEPANLSASLANSFLVAEPIVTEPIIAEPTVTEPTLAEPMIVDLAAAPVIVPPPRADEPQKQEPAILAAAPEVLVPPVAGMRSHADASAEPAPSDFVVVPRHVIYAQGGLLAAVALGSLIIGAMLGRSFAPRPASDGAARECHVRGSVSYTTGTRTRPDRGAVVVLIPLTADAAGERAQVAGLRPSDPPPEANHPGLGVIRQLGGSYLRADPNGRFETRVPAGRYWLLIISHHKRADTPPSASDVRTLGRYFENAADLLEDREHRLRPEAIAGDQKLTIEFADQ
jgi:hypothetical protein